MQRGEFIRMWDLYLGYREAAFLERHIGDVQLLLAKARNRRKLYGEPWAEPDAGVQLPTRAEVLEPRIR